jgi:hypothetical protein
VNAAPALQLFNPKFVFGDDIEVEATFSLKNQDSGLPIGLQGRGTTVTATDSFTLGAFQTESPAFPTAEIGRSPPVFQTGSKENPCFSRG